MASNLVCYTGSGCNRVPHCADWRRNSLICYGLCNGVVVYRPDVSNSIPTFSVAHTKFIQRTRSGVRVIPRQLLKKVNLIHMFFFFFLSHSLFISVFASVVYAACICESGIGERVGVRSGGGLSAFGRSRQSRLALVTILLSEPLTGLLLSKVVPG